MRMALSVNEDLEKAVIEAIRAGDAHAFEGFMRRHGRWVRGVIFGVLGDADRVEEVAQQVWFAAWRRIGELRSADRWRPWLYRVARNAALDAGRDTRRGGIATQPLPDDPPATASRTPAEELIQQEQHAAMLTAIQSLPEHYREPFVLRHLEGWSYRQIGELLGMPVDTVETRLVRARRLLREMLQDKV